MDEHAFETFAAPGDDVERSFAAADVVRCPPRGRVVTDPEPLGTLIRPNTMRDPKQAGYRAQQIGPIEHRFPRFYRLAP